MLGMLKETQEVPKGQEAPWQSIEDRKQQRMEFHTSNCSSCKLFRVGSWRTPGEEGDAYREFKNASFGETLYLGEMAAEASVVCRRFLLPSHLR